MSEIDLEPLDADIVEALQAERGRPALAPDRHQAMSQRIRLALATSALAPAPGEPPAPSPATPAVGAGLGVKLGVALFAAGAVSGGLAGAALHAAVTGPREEAPLVVPAQAPTVANEAPAELTTQPMPEPRASAPIEAKRPVRKVEEVPRAQAPSPEPAPPSAPGSDTELAREHSMLEQARNALARGNAVKALDLVEHHASEFKQGRMAEERESLAVQALLALGREAEARRRADDFRHAFPESMLRPLIDSLVPPARRPP